MSKLFKSPNSTTSETSTEASLNLNNNTCCNKKEKKHVSYSELAVLGTFEASMKKANKKWQVSFCEGLLGGFFISLAYIAAIFVSQAVGQTGIKIMLMGAVFPIAILLITFVGGSLYTSNCIGFLNVTLKNVKAKPFTRNLFVVYAGNFIGTLVAAFILLMMGFLVPFYGTETIDHGAFGEASTQFYLKKIWTIGSTLQWDVLKTQNVEAYNYAIANGATVTTEITFGMFVYVFFANLFSGIFCNILIASTLYLTYSTKSATACCILLCFDILAFVVGGFQHSVANAFLFWMDMFQSTNGFKEAYQISNLWNGFSSSSYVSATTSISSLTIGYFIGANLIPCFIGNFIGGGIILPFVLYIIFREKINNLSKELIVKYSKEKLETLKDNLVISMKNE